MKTTDNKKKSKRPVIVYMLTSAIWYAVSVMYYLRGNTSMGVVYMSIGSMFLCIGAAMLTRINKEATTIDFYEKNAKEFAEETFKADMSEIRDKFVALLPKGGSILDWGCGSGRDSVAFLQEGFQVEAKDAADEMAKIASENTGLEVKCESFRDFSEHEKYDGIWACASILHSPKEYIPEIIGLAREALRPNGVFYMSFKYGDFEGERNGRYFTDMTEESFGKIIKPFKQFEVIEMWITTDVRENHDGEKWLNVLLRKIEN